MNARAVLHLPWYASNVVARWICLIFLILAALFQAWAMVFAEHDMHKPIVAGMLTLPGLVLAVWWGLAGGARLLLIHRQLRAQRVPAATRSVIYSLLMTLAATSTLASAPSAWVLGHWGTLSLFTLMISSIGLLYALLPAWLAAVLSMLPLIALNFSTTLGWPNWDQSRFFTFVAGTTALMLLLVALRWYRLLDAEPKASTSFNRPPVFSSALVNGYRHARLLGPSERPDRTWLIRPHVPAETDATTTIRIAFGGPFAPQTGGSYAMQFLLPLALGLSVVLLARMGYRITALGALLSMVLFASEMLPIMHYKRLRTLYRGATSGELGLLALLPRMGSPSEQRWRLQRAVLWPLWTRIFMVSLVAMALAVMIEPARLAWSTVATMMLFTTAAASSYTALALHVLSGSVAELNWKLFVAGVLGFPATWALVFFTIAIPLSQAAFAAHPDKLEIILTASWAIAFIVIAGFVRHYRTRFQRRPHPFLQR